MTATADHHPAVQSFLDHLTASGRASTAASYGAYLSWFETWLTTQGVDLLDATTATIASYQQFVANEYRKRDGSTLALSTQCTVLVVVRTLYAWLHRRNVVLFNPAASIIPANPPKSLVVAKDYLTLDEAIALITTLSDLVAEAQPQSVLWALAVRNLSAISVALATGRRSGGLVSIQVSDIDVDRAEVRVSWEKGKTGRVLPVAAWAMALVAHYITAARPLILNGRESDALFPTIHAPAMTHGAFVYVLEQAIAATITRHPDLTSLASKRISTHSLRVTFATVMFSSGIGIRSLNELMLHADLNTTAQYTPIPLEDLRRVMLAHHPRA
ncbi:MAG: tyrosine-type recombinase/integrase [Planctomycetota bacterium]